MLRRIQLFEICDQPWLPHALRERLQTCLTLLWTFRFPGLQPASPASLVSRVLLRLLGSELEDCVFVDYCAGAGGPTPWIEKDFNNLLSGRGREAEFVLSDISPHPRAWKQLAAESPHIHLLRNSVDATRPKLPLLDSGALVVSSLASSQVADVLRKRKTFGLFFLAFHHFPDDQARSVLRAALDQAGDSDGFAIFELQGRTVREILMVLFIPLLIALLAPVYFYDDPLMLFFIFIAPLIPPILAFDGTVSCLRTRTEDEITGLVKQSGAELDDWNFVSGSEMHTWPLGRMRYFAALKR